MVDKETIKSIEKLLNLSREKLEKGIEISTYEHIRFHFNRVVCESSEVRKHFKENNVIFLEDELTDIFWDYRLLLRLMEKGGYIRSMDNVFSRAL